MTGPGHDSIRDDLGLYALGALDADARASFEVHLATCPECRAELAQIAPVIEALSQSVPQVDPPAGLRDRVLALVHPAGRTASAPSVGGVARWAWLAAAAAVVISVGLGGYAMRLQARIDDLSSQLSAADRALQAAREETIEARRALDGAQSDVRVLLAPDLTRVVLAGEGSTPAASGRAYYSPSEGLLFTARNLRALPESQVYQLWLVTAAAPVSAGLLPLETTGSTTVLLQPPAGAGAPVAFAVTIEPAGGVPAPTGERVLLGVVAAS